MYARISAILFFDSFSCQIRDSSLSNRIPPRTQIGLVEKEWLDTLATINPTEVTYTDFVTAGSMLARELREAKGCDYVIALTHMRTPNDIRFDT